MIPDKDIDIEKLRNYLIFLLPLFGLLLTSIAFLVKHLFDNYTTIDCNGQKYQCKTMSKWAYAGIILSLIILSLLILNSFVFHNKKEIPLSYIIIIQITLVIGIIGCAFTLQRTTLPCDDKYVCKDSDTKETFMKISSIISIIFASILILVTLLAIFFGKLQI